MGPSGGQLSSIIGILTLDPLLNLSNFTPKF
ncbi:uncharacterized protein G2W53_037691 [Senna tora]|uniref:Uncharacterized protein n=1 Tax=Senna tora TaxID=362788 RepID=A0A834SN11_9FABA|nr:uncharacterized protein G2W53_037691 [Senna tora]